MCLHRSISLRLCKNYFMNTNKNKIRTKIKINMYLTLLSASAKGLGVIVILLFGRTPFALDFCPYSTYSFPSACMWRSSTVDLSRLSKHRFCNSIVRSYFWQLEVIYLPVLFFFHFLHIITETIPHINKMIPPTTPAIITYKLPKPAFFCSAATIGEGVVDEWLAERI